MSLGGDGADGGEGPGAAPEPSSVRLARIGDLRDLEGGTYWPRLRPHFLRPEYRRLRYRIRERAGAAASGAGPVSVRGATAAGGIDVAYIADRLGATMSVADEGLPDYCLTAVGRGGLTFSGAAGAASGSGSGTGPIAVGRGTGLLYRGHPGTTLEAAGGHERLALWIPEGVVRQRLGALLGGPVEGPVEFAPAFDWEAGPARGLGRLVRLLEEDLAAPEPSILAGEAAGRSFADLLVYTLLRAVPHSQTERLLRPERLVLPGTLRRAEAFIEAHVETPLALHEVAAAAGCSVRSLQAAFRRFRGTTPLLAIRQARLAAARAAMARGVAGATLTEVAHRYGFANAGRFTRLYREAFGEAPGAALRRGR